MSKLSPTGQSMAALFSPEGEKLRAAQKDKARSGAANAPAGGFRIPGGTPKGDKPGDSLGNPASPGYEPLNLKKKTPQEEAEAKEQGAQQKFEAPEQGPSVIRLTAGWEKILLAQKKICEKARGIFTLLEAPVLYHSQRKSSALQSKSRGAILDVDLAETQAQALAKAEAEKKKGEEAA